MVAVAVQPTPAQTTVRYHPRGASADLFRHHEPEIVVSGPAGTGKTYGCLWRLHLAALKYPGMRGIMLRKVQEDLTASALVTYQERVLGSGTYGVRAFGGSKLVPAAFQYPNGSTLLIGGLDKPDKVMSREYDLIYCFVGDTKVESATEIEKAFCREYSGPLVTIRTTLGNELTGTPNHPVMTDRGWVALGNLNEGDNVISRRLGEEVAVRNPDVHHDPPSIAEVSGALAGSETVGAVTERVMGVDMDFHGDGWQGNVDVVTADGQFERASQAAMLEPGREHGVGRGDLDLPVFKGLGPLDQILFRARLPFGRSASDVGERFHPFGISFTPSERRLAHGDWFESSTPEFGLEGGVADANTRRRPSNPRLPVEITLDRIVHVIRTDGDPGNVRHVYNLQTSGNSYVANNIIVHNCNEATEVSEEDWEKLTTRARWGVMPYQQVYGDCNPQGEGHWLYRRFEEGKTALLFSVHEDNPALFDPATKQWTPAGVEYIARLDALTGFRRGRLRLGLWTAAEGVVYPAFNKQTHMQKVDCEGWETVLGLDVGTRNPTALLTFRYAGDRLHIEHEHYERGMSSDEITDLAEQRFKATRATHLVVDPSAAGLIESLRKRGVKCKKADNDVLIGISRVTSILPTLTVDPSCKETITEFGLYRYPDGRRSSNDTPVKEFDHAMDVIRYTCMDLYGKPKPKPVAAPELGHVSLWSR